MVRESESVSPASVVPWPERRPYPAIGLARLRSLAVLFKLRVVVLLMMAAMGGAVIGAAGPPAGSALLVLTVTGTLAAAGASAINQYLERQRDKLMVRTRHRPLPSGQIAHPIWVLFVGQGMILLAVALALLWGNRPLALFLALGAAIYVGVYTLWLKPRTALNIVIGGSAGSCAVLSGGAAVGQWAAPGVLALALLVFLWTPVHFWSLAMAYRRDYAGAGFPMLPTRCSPRQAAGWIALHTLATGLVALVMAAHPALGGRYLLPVALATGVLGQQTLRLLVHPTEATALSLYKVSNAYLGIVLVALTIACLWR